MSAPSADIEAITAAIRHHARMLSPTGSGVRCECGAQYPHIEAWRRHLAHLARQALAR